MRSFFLLLLLVAFLFGKSEKIEVYAGKVTTHKDIVNIAGDVVVVYGDYILTAKRARYDKKSGIMEMFENVKVANANEYKILGEYAKLNIKEKERTFKPFYMLDQRSKVWLSGEKGCAKDNDIDIDEGTLSGCDPKDPLWQIEFSSSDYNAKSKWLNLYNTVLYIYDIPVFYTPYFGYSLDTTRRTGLLTPSFGYSNAEGVYFEQPLYIAEQNWWDLEFKPQIRTNRGSGLYGTFRFVDSKVSHGELNFGYFKEKTAYFLENDLAYQKHYGINFDYSNSDFLSSWFGYESGAQSVVYIETENMNDVDYINLSTNDTTKNTTASQTLSRANIFYNTDNDYIATYMKYYVDLTKENNDETLQQLPSLHYHSYLDTFFDDHLLYNLNLKSTYLYRKTGATAVQTNLDIPIALRTTLFDEYLNISYQTQLYAQYSSFQTENNVTTPSFENGYYARNYNQFTLSTQLLRPYDSFIHSIGFSTSYIRGGFEKRSGFYEINKGIDCTLSQNRDICEFYNISDIQEAVTLNFNQYLYNSQGKEILYHRLTDIIAITDNGGYTVGELESELDLAVTDHLKFYNNIFFNFTYDKVSKQLNKISYNDYGFNIALSHFYKKNFTSTTLPRTSYITSSLRYRYNSQYSYNAAYDYDTQLKQKKKAEIGFLYEKRCWNFGLRYTENNRPILLQNGEAASIYDRYIYFTIVLKPLMKPTRSDFFGLRLPRALSGS